MRREQNKGREKATEKLNNSIHAIGKGADYLSHIAVTWGFCTKTIVEHIVLYFSIAIMIPKLIDHTFSSTQPQLVPVLENTLQVHTRTCLSENKTF